MSTLHQPHGRAEADTSKGELRKPQDDSSQPGQGGDGDATTQAAVPRSGESIAGHRDSTGTPDPRTGPRS